MSDHPTRAEEEAQSRRARILACAEEVFLRTGADGFTMEAVASEARYSVASLYNYFKNKSALTHALRVRLVEKLVGDLDRLPAVEGTTDQVLTGWVGHLTRDAEGSRRLIRALMQERPADLPPHGKRDLPAHSPWEALQRRIADLFARGQARGEVRTDIDARTLALAFDGVMHSFAMRWAADDEQGALSDAVPLMVGLFLAGAAAR